MDVDPIRIREVLTNLVANALRYSPPDATIGVGLSRDAARRTARIEVRDRGPGLPPELVGHVFDRFARSTDSGGSGLGLAIAKYLVEAHGGAIGLDGRAGAGPRPGSSCRCRQTDPPTRPGGRRAAGDLALSRAASSGDDRERRGGRPPTYEGTVQHAIFGRIPSLSARDTGVSPDLHDTPGTSVLRPIVFGANDGLVSNLALVMGVAGRHPCPA